MGKHDEPLAPDEQVTVLVNLGARERLISFPNVTLTEPLQKQLKPTQKYDLSPQRTFQGPSMLEERTQK